ncbi:hypothetical protein ACN4EE_09145 [Geminocystis sp. CENA526]|uniref:hypothetical protein n=1 Tax=Geminocystis sp. CENA526 TaxID=1355871 RepID=UPI003D6FD103
MDTFIPIITSSANAVKNLAENPEFQSWGNALLEATVNHFDCPLLILPATILIYRQNGQIQDTLDETYNTIDCIDNIASCVSNVSNSICYLTNSVAVLQSGMTIIGVGTFAGGGLSGLNLYQTLQLREDVRHLRQEVKDGFIDLKKAFRSQGDEIIKRIDDVANDIKFEAHRLILVKAYGEFLEATRLIKIALTGDESFKNSTLQNAQLMLTRALADYNNPHIFDGVCAAGELRRRECAWAIQQALIMTYQLQNQTNAVKESIEHLSDNIMRDLSNIVDRCESSPELDFLFPEVLRIYTQDLPALQIQALPADEQKQLLPSTIDDNNDNGIVEEPPEQKLYDLVKPKSHYEALKDSLRFTLKPSLREEYIDYVRERASAIEYNGIALLDWANVSNLNLANIYHYFRLRK